MKIKVMFDNRQMFMTQNPQSILNIAHTYKNFKLSLILKRKK